jgi:Tfp pilus assembly protein PilO
MSVLRIWVAGATVVSLVILGFGWLVGVSPRLAEAARADADRQGVELINAGYEATLIELQALSVRLPELQAQLTDLSAQIPTDPELSPLLGQLNALAGAAGVTLVEVTASPPVLFPPDLLAGTGVTELVALPVTIRVTGEGTTVDSFIRQVQFGLRLLLVERFDLTDDPVNASVTLQGLIFVLPKAGAILPTDEVGDQPTAVAPPAEEPAG